MTEEDIEKIIGKKMTPSTFEGTYCLGDFKKCKIYMASRAVNYLTEIQRYAEARTKELILTKTSILK